MAVKTDSPYLESHLACGKYLRWIMYVSNVSK